MHWNIFQTTQEIVIGTSNLLVDNMYWMVTFKIHVFNASLFEEMPGATLRFGNYLYYGCLIQYIDVKVTATGLQPRTT